MIPDAIFRFWVLDVDGTLLTLPVQIEAAREQLRRLFLGYGVERRFSPVLARIHEAARLAGAEAELVQRAYGVLERHEQEAVGEARACPGAAAFLRALGQEPVALVSNNAAGPLRAAAGALGLSPGRLVGVVGRTPGLPPKPDPAPLLRALDELGADPAEVVCVGDRPADMAMARAGAALLSPRGISVRALGVNGDPRQRQALLEAGAEQVFGDLWTLAASRAPEATSRSR